MSSKESVEYLKENLNIRAFLIFFRNFGLTLLLITPIFAYVGISSLREISLSNDKYPFTFWNGKDPKTEIVIVWETVENESSAVWLGKSSDNLNLIYDGDAGGVQLHRVELSGLEPGTQYYYRVGVASTPPNYIGNINSFKTAPNSENTEFKFALIGDSQQIFGIGAHERIAQTVGALEDLAFVGTLGDIAQESDHQGNWNQYLMEAQAFMSGTAYAPLMGNHDGWYGEKYSENKYKKYFGFATDPIYADDKHTLFNYTFSYSNTQFIIAEIAKGDDEKLDRSRNINHDKWLNATLAASQDKTFRILMLHRQVFATDAFNTDLINRIVPIAEKYKVSMVIYGHFHHYERFLYDNVTYLLQACGGVMPTDTGINPTTPYTKAFSMGAFYTHFAINTTHIVARTLTPDNDLIDMFALKNDNSRAVLVEGGGM